MTILKCLPDQANIMNIIDSFIRSPFEQSLSFCHSSLSSSCSWQPLPCPLLLWVDISVLFSCEISCISHALRSMPLLFFCGENKGTTPLLHNRSIAKIPEFRLRRVSSIWKFWMVCLSTKWTSDLWRLVIRTFQDCACVKLIFQLCVLGCLIVWPEILWYSMRMPAQHRNRYFWRPWYYEQSKRNHKSSCSSRSVMEIKIQSIVDFNRTTARIILTQLVYWFCFLGCRPEYSETGD